MYFNEKFQIYSIIGTCCEVASKIPASDYHLSVQDVDLLRDIYFGAFSEFVTIDTIL